jgi:hypothetical protein
MGQIDHPFTTFEQPLFTHWVAVVPWHAGIWAALGNNSSHALSALPSALFFLSIILGRSLSGGE